METHMIWIDDDNCSGWGCRRCSWRLAAPQLESTVAVLVFNRTAQRTFDNHACAPSCPDAPSTILGLPVAPRRPDTNVQRRSQPSEARPQQY
jgi:hypothetical protein